MKKLQRTLSALLCVIMLFTGVCVPASAVDINDSSVFLKQEVRGSNGTCTLASAAMMLRRRAILDGVSDWASITESSIKSDAWIANAGLRWSFSYMGMNVGHKFFSGSATQKKNTLISLLNSHPEGIVVFRADSKQYHAILVTDYDSATDTFYCADPIGKTARVPLSSSTLVGSTQDEKIGGLSAWWYITNAGNTKSASKYTLYFDAQGGTVSPSSVTYTYGVPLKSLPTPTRDGYTFRFWRTSASGSVSMVVTPENAVYFKENTTLYAYWEKIETKKETYKVTLDDGSTCQLITVTNGETYGSLPNPMKDGYTFDGWYTSASGGTRVTSSTTVNLSADQTLYAHWTKKKESSTLTINPTSYPEGTLQEGEDFALKGTVTSNYPITTVTAILSEKNEGVIYSYTEYPNSTSFSFDNSALAKEMSFSTLAPGTYTLFYEAEDSGGGVRRYCPHRFFVEAKNNVPEEKSEPELQPVASTLQIKNLSASVSEAGIRVRFTASSNYPISSVSVVYIRDPDGWIRIGSYQWGDGISKEINYDKTFSFTSTNATLFSGDGYKVEVIACDESTEPGFTVSAGFSMPFNVINGSIVK